ncbi:hypothetical protein ACYSNR_12840 [Enterococcus sp. LJL128]
MTVKKIVLISSLASTIIIGAIFLFSLYSFNEEKKIWEHLSKKEADFLLRKEDGVYTNTDGYSMSATDYSLLYYLAINESGDDTEIYTKKSEKKDFWYITRSTTTNGEVEIDYVIFETSAFLAKDVSEKEFKQAIKKDTGLSYSKDQTQTTIEPLYVKKYVD